MDYVAEMKESADRREHERFPVQDGAWVALRPHSHKSPKGRIIDISRGGLAFYYAVGEDKPDDSCELDICFAEYGFCLRCAPFRIISDYEIKIGNPPISKPVNRLGVQFEELTTIQQSQLNHFMQNYTAL